MSEILGSLLAERNEPGTSARKWKIGTSKHGGRGVVAERDIQSGELIFVDFPILFGPKSNNELIGCTTCSENSKPLRSCSKNCRLPFCSDECENHLMHREECLLLRTFNTTEEEWSPSHYRSLTLLRSLFMSAEDRKLVRLLHANRGKHVDNQVREVQHLLENTLKETDLEWIRHCCGVLDGTAFEIELDSTGNSLKGLYPLSAMMNHNCAPNTRLCYTDGATGYKMLVIASKFIPQGAEIFTSYCPLIWATNLRRRFLMHTKHFQCECDRCRDRTEFGTNLQALRCTCGKLLLPTEPLNLNSPWKCESCREAKGAEFSMVIQKNHKSLPNRQCYLPDCNYIQVQGKIEAIFKATRNGIRGLNESDLNNIVNKCVIVLRLIDRLNLGNTQFKGKLCEQLALIVQVLQQRGIEYDREEIDKYCENGKLIRVENEAAKNISTRGIP